ncbi:hypothetical protein J2Y63_002427 [Shinella sp. BE166]|uniref:hypothetical protein n=1 Tax=Shinella sp. BE166 TaxID=3373918 RepID=UPI003EB6C794
MTDFWSSKSIKAVSKHHCCEQCGKRVEAGSRAEYTFGKYEGDVFGTYTHPECYAAANAYADLNGLYGEEYPWFQHMDETEHDLGPWLREHHPIVADRLGIPAEAIPA